MGYDEATTQYAITINGETTNYSLFSTDDINTRVLFKSDIKQGIVFFL